MEAWGFKMLACCWVFGGMFDLLRSLLWFSEGPSSGIVGGYRYRVPGIFLAWRQANEVFAKRANFFLQRFRQRGIPRLWARCASTQGGAVACLTLRVTLSIMAFSFQRTPSFTL
jgi:hypothetical protein